MKKDQPRPGKVIDIRQGARRQTHHKKPQPAARKQRQAQGPARPWWQYLQLILFFLVLTYFMQVCSF